MTGDSDGTCDDPEEMHTEAVWCGPEVGWGWGSGQRKAASQAELTCTVEGGVLELTPRQAYRG